MASIEMVDKLRSRTGVTYEEAREALDESENDMLDALIWLEKNGKATPPRVSYYSTDSDSDAGTDSFGDMPYGKEERYYDADKMSKERRAKKDKRREQAYKSDSRADRNASARKHAGGGGAYYYNEGDSRAKSSSFAKSAFDFIGKAFHIGNTTMLEVKRYGQEFIKIPLTLLVIGCFLFFHVILILLPVGLFFGFRYNISGNHFNDSAINSAMDSTANAVDGIKEAFTKKKRE